MSYHSNLMSSLLNFEPHLTLTSPSSRTLAYNPKELLGNLSDEGRAHFEEQYPAELYSDVARHRALVLGSDGGDTRWWLSRQNGVFYLTEDSERRIFGSDIPAFANKGKDSKAFEDANRRLHYIRNTSRNFANRKMVYGHVERHVSEYEWNRPVGHKYHFQTLPGEIREIIFGFVLMAIFPLEPKTILCSWTRELQLPDYILVGSSSQLTKTELQIRRQDRHGSFTEMRTVFRRPIDATCLRVSHQFQAEGAKILYGKNVYDLSRGPLSDKSHNAVYTLDALGRGVSHRDIKPRKFAVGSKTFIHYVDILMRDRPSDDKLPGWMYCDPFVRFLRTIGQKNSATLRDISLGGYVMEKSRIFPHRCHEGCRSYCLQYHLRMYGHFAMQYCTSLRALELHPQSGLQSSMLSKEEFVKHLIQILKSEIFRFRSLTELRVIGIDGRPLLTLEETREIMVQSAKDHAT